MAGRPLGALNKRTQELFDNLAKEVKKMTNGAVTDFNPIYHLACFAAGFDPVSGDKIESIEQRLQANIAVAPYIHSKLKATEAQDDEDTGPASIVVKQYVQSKDGKVVPLIQPKPTGTDG